MTITGAAADAIRALGFERRALGGTRGVTGRPSSQLGLNSAGRCLPDTGSVRIRASVDGAAFETSAFPHKASGGYLIPVKAAVRKAAGVSEGATVTVGLWL